MVGALPIPEGYELRQRAGHAWLVLTRDADEACALPVGDPAALRRLPGARAVQGRTQHWSVPLGTERVVVRTGTRGGLLGRLFGSYYWAISGQPRCAAELNVSVRARARGVPTPEVIAAVWQSARGGLYRAWVIVRELEGVKPLSAYLRPDVDASARAKAAEAAGRALATLHNAGFRHPDAHVGNLLIRSHAEDVAAWIVDLDGVSAVPVVGAHLRALALWRLARSVAKLRARGVAIPWTAAVSFLRSYLRVACCDRGDVLQALRLWAPLIRAKWRLSDTFRFSRPAMALDAS